MKNQIIVTNPHASTFVKDIAIYSESDIMEGEVFIKIVFNNVIQIRRAGIDSKNTRKVKKFFNQYRFRLRTDMLEVGVYELAEDQSDTDRLTYLMSDSPL